jgi:hypothetical protein
MLRKDLSVTTSVRTYPRISLNKLGEYMTATASRRRRIIRDQKYPPEVQTARYTEAHEPIAKFLLGGASDTSIISSALTRLEQQKPKSEWDETRIECCIAALESILKIRDFSFLDGMSAVRGRTDTPKMVIEKVVVSVRPEILLQGCDKGGNAVVGAVKLSIGKTASLTDEAGSYIGAVLQEYVDGNFANGAKVPHRKCIILDVFNRKIHTAPANFIRRRKEISDACAEIATMWVTL